jgi:hypothetical protein
MKSMLLSVALLGLVGVAVTSADEAPCCSMCGCHEHVTAYCRATCEQKAVKETHYKVECEDFCPPGPSQCCGKECCSDGCDSWVHKIWKVSCSEVRTRKKLVKYETEKQVPVTKCTVVYLCPQCCQAH